MAHHPEIILSCEHAGNHVPEEFQYLFVADFDLLNGHRGWDIGAFELAKEAAHRLRTCLFYTTITRLLVENNRTIGHPELFSLITRRLDHGQKAKILQSYYHPFQNALSTAVIAAIERAPLVIHLSIHTFTPYLNDKMRNADVGLLYNPKHTAEKDFCINCGRQLKQTFPYLRIRRNYPYRGNTDSIVAHFRKKYYHRGYLGIEIEVNQRIPLGDQANWPIFRAAFCRCLLAVISKTSEF